ncbi:MAG: hypothetical protein COT74_01740 [Bdellovibrionales bacterium CG10_big_fil_rev_8_21_14_0_10_45_34]|nr:MAG: hypothetical protein COT74_01740 [Bdellovibrionales bacterium CG10_big_fil_rev_8_21_14_0_10_45_34]
MHSVEKVFQEFCKGDSRLTTVKNITDQKLFEVVTHLGIKNQNLTVVLEEVLINAQEHGDGHPSLHYKVDGNLLVLVISDSGVGIHQKIPENLRLSDTRGKSSSSIIRLSLEEGITGTGTVGRGMGLYYLSRFASENQASIFVASDQGAVIQVSSQFYERRLTDDLGCTLVILETTLKDAGI